LRFQDLNVEPLRIYERLISLKLISSNKQNVLAAEIEKKGVSKVSWLSLITPVAFSCRVSFYRNITFYRRRKGAKRLNADRRASPHTARPVYRTRACAHACYPIRY